MKLAQGLFIVFLLSIMLGCGPRITLPSEQEIRNADYGPYPDNYVDIIRSYLTMYLKDPGSAQVKFTTSPTKQWSTYWGGVKYGWGICMQINAKNGFGAYTGFKRHYFLIKDNSVVQHISSEDGTIGEKAAASRCP